MYIPHKKKSTFPHQLNTPYISTVFHFIVSNFDSIKFNEMNSVDAHAPHVPSPLPPLHLFFLLNLYIQKA